MNLLDFFKEYLLTRDNQPSKVTIKNYLADVRKFVLWVEFTYHTSFNAQTVSSGMITRYREEKLSRIKRGTLATSSVASASSVERYMSSLRKFFSCLKENGLISTSPFDMPNPAQPKQEFDKWNLKSFKNFLFTNKNSHLTIKNYIIDVRQFLEWAEQVTKSQQHSYIVDRRSVLEKINAELIEEYKNRLLHEGQLSPVSINRKLSSLRRYFSWAYQERLLPNIPAVASNIAEDKQSDANDIKEQQKISTEGLEPVLTEITMSEIEPEENQTRIYSKIPPVRLGQKITRGLSLLFDAGFIIPVAFFTQQLQYAGWILTGKRVFSKQMSKALETTAASTLAPLMADPIGKIIGSVPNFKKSFYAPYKISTEGLPLYKKAIYHARYTRPKWYKRYHSYPLVHYIHFAVLIIFMSAVGFGLYRSYNPSQQNQALAAKASPPRVLSFQGRLTDSKDNPITANTNLRFAIYNSQSASGSALLWQEVQNVTPDQDGIFSVLLGKNSPIPQSLFGDNSALFLGIAVGHDSELIPRQQIATVAYATNAELLQGMPAITQPNAGTTNVILALDSAGNLTIGGNASPTFQATGGTFTLSGKILNLTTTTGSNGNIIINPDGTGIVDIQKPLTNSGTTSNIAGVSGAVEIDDTLAVLASDGQPAIAINQTGSGPILTASQAGATKFRVGNDGSGYFAQSLGINELNPSSKLYVNSGTDLTTASFNTANPNGTGTTLFSFLTNGSQYASLNRNTRNDLELDTNSNLIFNPSGNIGIGTTIPDQFKVQVAGNTGPNVDSAYDLGSSTSRFNNLYVNQIFSGTSGVFGFFQRSSGAVSLVNSTDDFLVGSSSTSSAQVVLSGTTGNITASGLTLSGLTTDGGVLYANGSGTVAQTAAGTNNQCLLGGSTPTWGSCATGTTDQFWQNINDAVSPLISTSDLLIGGTSTDSAKFAFINVASGTPTASISGNITLNSAGSIQTTNNQPLTLGGNTTGDVTINSQGNVALTASGANLIANGTLTGLTGLTVSSGSVNLPNGTIDNNELANSSLTVIAGTGLGGGGSVALGGSVTLSNAGVTSITGTANQINVSTTSGDVTLSLPQDINTTSSPTFAGITTNSLTLASDTITDITGNGLQTSGNALTLKLTSAGTTATTGSGSGLEVDANGLSLIRGCGDGELLKWNSFTEQWECNTDLGGNSGASGVINTKENGTIVSTQSGTLDFLGSDFDLNESPVGEINIAIDYPNSHITRSTQAETITGGWSFTTAATTFTSALNLPGTSIFTSTGNLGIGTTAPAGKLDVVGTGNQKSLAILEGDGNQDLLTASVSGSTKFLVDKTGNVGIGTNSPQTALNVVGALTLEKQSAFPGDYSFVFSDPNTRNEWANLYMSSSDHSFRISTYDGATNFFDRFTIQPVTGNIGIGTTVPAGLLQVNGTANQKALTQITGDGNQDLLTASVSGTTKFIVNKSGNVGIGTTNPSLAQLQVTGDIGLTGNLFDTGDGVVNVNDDLQVAGNDILDSASATRLSLGNTNTATGDILNVAASANSGSISLAAYDGLMDLGSGNDGTSGIDFKGSSNLGSDYQGRILYTDGGGFSIFVGGSASSAVSIDSTGLLIANAGLNVPSGKSTTLASFTNNGGLLYTNGSGVVAQTGAGTGTQCLLGGTTPTWGSCATGTADQYWTISGGALSTINSTADLLIGGSATSSAKFAVLNMANGTPTASVSATTGVRNGITLGGDGTIQSLRNNSLILGGNTTGNIFINPRNGTSGGFFAPATDNVTSLGASSSARFKDLFVGPSSLHIQCTTGDGCNNTLDWSMGVPTSGGAKGSLVIGANLPSFTSGTPALTINTLGNMGIGTSTPVNKLDVNGSLAVGSYAGTNSAPSNSLIVSGNVGVGTTSPAGLMELSQNGDLNMLLTEYGAGGNTNIIGRKANGTSGSPTAAAADDTLLRIGGRGYGATGFSSSSRAAIDLAAAQAWTDANQGTYMAFKTTPLNSTTLTEGMRLTAGGNLGIGVTNPGATLDLGSGTIQGAGLSTNCTGSSSVLQWSSSSKQFSCGAQDQTASAAKTSDTTKTFDTSLTNDPDLQFTVGANETWVFSFDNSWSVNANTGMQEFISAPAGSTCSLNYFDIQIDGGSGDGIAGDPCSQLTTITLNNSHKYYERIYGVVTTGATGGTVALRWAQNSSGAGALTLYAGSSMVAYKKSGADVAEMYYTKDKTITPGTIVGMDSSIKAGVKTVEGAYNKDVMGIVTTNPGLVLSDGTASGFPTNVALVGRVPVKVSSINGPIHAGDPIVPSDIPGVGMKATKPSEIVGKAMEDYDNSDPQAVGMIMVYVKETWYDPDVYITDTGNLSVTASPSAGTYTVTNNNEIVDRIGAFKDAVIGKITAGILNVGQLSAENITVAGMSLRDYILSVVGQQQNTPNIVSPIDGKLAVSVLSPLAPDSDVSLNLDKDKISVKNSKGQKVAGIDSQGNATFSGTLTADKLKANDLDLSDEALARLKDKLAPNATQSAVTVTNITNIYTNASDSASNVSLTPTPTASPSVTPLTPGTTNSSDTTIQSDYANMASMSGVLGYVPNLSSDFATFTKGLMSFGPTSLSDTSVAGQLSVDGNMILSDNSINVLGADFEIQPLRQGNVSFMGGLVKIDTEGNMSVGGNSLFAKNVTIKGILATNIISPVPGEDLVIQLGGTKNGDTEKTSNFVITDASGSAKFQINNLGDLIASGSGTFKSLAAQALQIVRGAQADTSVTETVATSSAGTAVIGKYQSERTVFSPYVKADSLIYITPTSDTGGLTPYIARQTAEDKDAGTKGSFTIQIPETTLKDIKVNWWIVN